MKVDLPLHTWQKIMVAVFRNEFTGETTALVTLCKELEVHKQYIYEVTKELEKIGLIDCEIKQGKLYMKLSEVGKRKAKAIAELLA